jgi:hypothetical protein
MDVEQQLQSKNIIGSCRMAFKYFKHPDGRNTFNFWPKDPKVLFPNSVFLSRLNQSQALPDDLDDTSVILVTETLNDSSAKAVKSLFSNYANGKFKTIKNTFRAYRDISAYSTWLGTKMPVDFDIAVQCNFLFFNQTYKLPFTKEDSATIELIQEIIKTRQYLTHPKYVSPHYADASIILYHIARLLSRFPIEDLIQYREQLITDAQLLLRNAKDDMTRIILCNTLFKLGVEEAMLPIINIEKLISSTNDYAFFKASFSSMLPNPVRRWLIDLPAISYSFFSPAFNKTLVLEYLLLKKQSNKSTALIPNQNKKTNTTLSNE